MAFILRQLFIGSAILALLGSRASAVVPYTVHCDSGSPTCVEDNNKVQGVSNQEVMQALMENRKLLQELLQQLERIQSLSASSAQAVPSRKESN